MGKKTVIKQDASESLKEQEIIEANIKKDTGSGAIKRLEGTSVFINSSYNNTIITVADHRGNVLGWSSAGTLGFKGPKKATPFAATSVVDALIQKLKRIELGKVSIFVRGVGGGREAAVRAFINKGLDVQLIKDVTPIPHNGPRPPKPRRV
ncbi:MAG: 30S ribosomal protein S11 [Parcubacteria group bacterium GW2011_GWB1_46_8]|nr:MAG: 30S ribosomal protein S11 [Parcubacteria group bacterium GW2011_GWF1_45_5]KKU10525.1 MAG: 30S ribosomal protein S11 [Parcubacteria group bacterium GW2011_GWA1_45_7]KKU46609.1 MAG: 30S ribosomal protein S11 [Parcubacteria group bacterium GW2011_GWB1_46_8]